MNSVQSEVAGFASGDRVCHSRDSNLEGVIVALDSDVGGLTTCSVVWGATSLDDALAAPHCDRDVQWTNKLVLLQECTS